MSGAIEFDPTLYRGTAGDYGRFRVPYPQSLFDHLVSLVKPSGRGRLMDLACGTGQITFALADRFAEAWAVDQEQDMIDLVANKATGSDHVRAIAAPAEELDAPSSTFELVAIGNAFHRLRREAVAANTYRWLQPNGHIALLWSTGPWTGNADWQRAMSEVLERWRTKLGAEARVPAGWDRVRRERPDTEVLDAAGFDAANSARFPTPHAWTADALIGFVYSTSALPRAVVGARSREFERDLRRGLDGYATGGKLVETIDFACEVARRPA